VSRSWPCFFRHWRITEVCISNTLGKFRKKAPGKRTNRAQHGMHSENVMPEQP
jgi:hypothetical protein